MLTVYSKTNCQQCDAAITILKSKRIDHKICKIDEVPDAREFLIKDGHKSLPQFYDDGWYVGDYKTFIEKF